VGGADDRSDHSPSTLDLKSGDDFLRIWGGISAARRRGSCCLPRRLDLAKVAAVTGGQHRAPLWPRGKGLIATAYDADLWLVDLSYDGAVRNEDLLYRIVQRTPGPADPGRTVRTLVRGKTVFVDGKPTASRVGR